MSIEDQVDVEDALQRWGEMGPEDAHIYATTTVGKDVLARKIVDAKRYLVGVHDHGANMITAVCLDLGDIRTVTAPAFLFIGILATQTMPNPNWTG